MYPINPKNNWPIIGVERISCEPTRSQRMAQYRGEENEISQLWFALKTARTYNQVKNVYDLAPRGSKLEAAAGDEMYEVLWRDLETAKTYDQVKKVYDLAPIWGKLETAAKAKMDQLRPDLNSATTYDKLKKVHDSALCGSWLEEQTGFDMYRVLFEDLNSATTYEEVRRVYNLAPRGSVLETAAKAKMEQLRK